MEVELVDCGGGAIVVEGSQVGSAEDTLQDVVGLPLELAFIEGSGALKHAAELRSEGLELRQRDILWRQQLSKGGFKLHGELSFVSATEERIKEK